MLMCTARSEYIIMKRYFHLPTLVELHVCTTFKYENVKVLFNLGIFVALITHTEKSPTIKLTKLPH